MLGRDDPISVTSSLPKRPRLNQLAAQAYEPVRMAELEKKALAVDDEYRKIRERNDAAAAIVQESPLAEWFPGVEWNMEDFPNLHPTSNHLPTEVVVYDAWDEARRKERVYLLLARADNEVHVFYATPVTETGGYYRYWSRQRIHSAADLGRILYNRSVSS